MEKNISKNMKNIPMCAAGKPGVFYITGKKLVGGKPEKIYYIRYRKNGRQIKEKVGRQYQDGMTPAKASLIRARKIEGKELSNREQKEVAQAKKNRWTINRLWQAYQEHNPTVKRLRSDRSLFKNHIVDKFGNKEPQEINSLELDRLRINLSKKLASPSVWSILELIKRIVNFGNKRGLCQGLPYVKMPKLYKRNIQPLSLDQLKRLWEAIEADSNILMANLIKMALLTGMRKSELFRLQWQDINFEQGFITLREAKSGHDEMIPLSDPVRGLLNNLFRPFPDSPYVFPGRGGQERKECKHVAIRVRDKAGLPKEFHPMHDLRHNFASILANSGKVQKHIVQKLMTHKDWRTTEIYFHMGGDAFLQGSNYVGEFINSVVGENESKQVVNMKEHKK